MVRLRIRGSARVKLAASISFVTALCLYMHTKSSSERALLELSFFKETVRFLDSLNGTGASCKLPEYDLYDPEIRPYIEKPPTVIECGYLQPYLTYMDWDGTLHLNQTEITLNKYQDLKCSYQSVTGNQMDDYKVIYGEMKDITDFPVQIKESVIRVKCLSKGRYIYRMIHSQILPVDLDVVQENVNIAPHRPSVLIFTIDSISRGNFIRSLPLTYDYLVNQNKMNVFRGLNKVADNTFPNMLALLAGFTAYPRNDVPNIPYWSVKVNSTIKRYDDMPIIWKTFKDANYITMYGEEYLDAIFSLLDVGFLEDPVDYYYRPTYVGLKDTLANINLNSIKFWDRSKWRYCLGNEPSYKYMLNYTEEFLTEMADLRYFALSFFVEMSHEYLNDVKNMDEDLLNFFKRLFDGEILNNTVVIVMGDHGHRFDGIRSTYIGRIEERMPFLGILLPKTLKATHPHLQAALESHENHLLSWYDIHETLVDLAEDTLTIPLLKDRPNAVGKSLFRNFTENRSCTQIGILPEYCMCDIEAQIPANSEKSIQAATIIVEKINSLLYDAENYYNKGDNRKCASLGLHQLKSAALSMKSYSANSSYLRVRVIIDVKPSRGLFEAAVEYKPGEDPQVLGDINRINKYGNQSSCINHDILRLYCFCI